MHINAQAQGFSLFELLIVVILLAVIMSFAIPQYIAIKNQAHTASVEAVAGGFSSAVGMVRGQWELEGRTHKLLKNAFVNYGGVIVGVDAETGMPTSDETTNDTRVQAITVKKCQQVFNVILQDSPSSTLSDKEAVIKSARFLVRYNAVSKQCIYYLTHFIDIKNIPINGEVTPQTVGFSYFPVTGKVHIFKN